jgi:hypothetical protein
MFRTALVSMLSLVGAAQAQFVNGDFETGDLSGWTVRLTPNGATAFQDAFVYDIDGPGPLEPSYAGRFGVGNEVPNFPNLAGIELFQDLNLTAGVEYTISFDWSAMRQFAGSNAEGGVFSLFVGEQVLATQAAGDTSSTVHHFGRISQNFAPMTTGSYAVGVRITRPYLVAGDLYQFVDNFRIESGSSCYPNCDGSTVEPILNVDDFTCFINEYASAQSLPHEQQLTHYSNCDGSTIAPVLNVDDFTCFINQYAQGCP